jgi:hypothetical protein
LSDQRRTSEWEILIGYPLEEAEQILKEEMVPFEVKFTVAPGEVSSSEDAYVVAVRDGEILGLICASPDWNVK